MAARTATVDQGSLQDRDSKQGPKLGAPLGEEVITVKFFPPPVAQAVPQCTASNAGEVFSAFSA